MTREDRLHEIEDHIAYLDRLTNSLLRAAVPGIPVNVLGFSQGVATVARWSLKGSTPIERLVLWAGSLPPELDRDSMRAWHHMHVDLVLGDEDVYARPAALQLMAQSMTAAGVPHRTHLFAGGHKLEPVLLKRLLSVSE
jgi:predicted esterase